MVVFYLDDETDLLEVFKDLFSSAGIEIHTFLEPERFLKALEVKRPTVVFIDYRLPGITGEEIAVKVPNSIKKVLVTGELSIEFHPDFDIVFGKPLPIPEVKSYLQSLR